MKNKIGWANLKETVFEKISRGDTDKDKYNLLIASFPELFEAYSKDIKETIDLTLKEVKKELKKGRKKK